MDTGRRRYDAGCALRLLEKLVVRPGGIEPPRVAPQHP